MKGPLKRIGAPLCVLLVCAALTAQPLAVETSAAAAILIDADSARVLYEKNADEEMLIASTTKIMTALVALESYAPDETVLITQEHMAEGSSMYLRSGERWKLETLLYGLMLSSGNDAALAVADHCGPGVEAFVAKMNEKAAALGMTHSSFANPNGLDDANHYSTARDMAVLAAYAMENDDFVRIVSTKSIVIDGRSMTNHNKLLSWYEGCIGIKTGYTKAAGRTLVSCAVRDDLRLVAVTLKDGNDWADHAALYDFGFSSYEKKWLARRGEQAAVLPVLNGAEGEVSLLFGADVSYPLQKDERAAVRLECAGAAFAPLSQGAYAGEAVFFLDGQEIGRAPLYYEKNVEALAQYENKRGFAGLFQHLPTFW